MLVLAAGVFSAALRSFRHPVMFRAGTFGVVATSFLAGWLLGGSVVLGLVFASTWFFLPWIEILTRVRRMRLPLDRQLESCAPPARSTFPHFGELSDEMESAHFEHVEDVSWNHDDMRQFYRLFYCEQTRTLGSICLIEQNEFAFYYVTLTSRTVNGSVFMTWNYPFAYGLHLMPKVVLNRVSGEKSVAELIAIHAVFLNRNKVLPGDLSPGGGKNLRGEIQSELREQLDHNLACGLLKRDGSEMIRYSVRGMFFLWFQFLRDFVRFT